MNMLSCFFEKVVDKNGVAAEPRPNRALFEGNGKPKPLKIAQ